MLGIPAGDSNSPRLQTADCRHSRYDTTHTHTHTKKTTTKHIGPHSSGFRRTASCPHRRPLVRVSNHFDESNQLSHPIQPPPQKSLQSSSRLRQGSAGLALSRFDLLPDQPPPPPKTPTRSRQPTDSPTQLPLRSYHGPPICFSPSLYRELFRPGHVRTLTAASYEPRALNARLEPL